MKKITGVNKIKQVLKNNIWEYFTHSNNYRGKEYGPVKHLNHTVEDIQLGHASLIESETSYIVRYAGNCKWIAKK